MVLWKLLGLGGQPAEAAPARGETETVRKIVDELNQMDAAEARRIACFAYLMGRVANADLNISKEETVAMERIVVEQGGVPEAQAVLVVQMAKSQNELFGATENFLVAREFGETANLEQRRALLRCLFAVSAADESITTAEDNEIRKISRELKLKHEDFITARLAYKDYLASKKKPAG